MKRLCSARTVGGQVVHQSVLTMFAIVAFIGPVSIGQGADTGKNVILIGWDGAQRNHVKEMIERHELPNLVALAKEGSMVNVDVTSGATDTKAGWTPDSDRLRAGKDRSVQQPQV